MSILSRLTGSTKSEFSRKEPDPAPSGYAISEAKQCPENGKICFAQKGRKG